MVSKLPDSAPAVADTSLSASQAMRSFVMAAKSAAGEIGSADRMKPIAEGIAQELSHTWDRVGQCVFNTFYSNGNFDGNPNLLNKNPNFNPKSPLQSGNLKSVTEFSII